MLSSKSVIHKILNAQGIYTHEYLEELSDNYEKLYPQTAICYVHNNDEDKINYMYMNNGILKRESIKISEDITMKTYHNSEKSSIDSYILPRGLKPIIINFAMINIKVVLYSSGKFAVACIGGDIIHNYNIVGHFAIGIESDIFIDIQKICKEIKFISLGENNWVPTKSSINFMYFSDRPKFCKFLINMSKIINGTLISYESYSRLGHNGKLPSKKFTEDDSLKVKESDNYYELWNVYKTHIIGLNSGQYLASFPENISGNNMSIRSTFHPHISLDVNTNIIINFITNTIEGTCDGINQNKTLINPRRNISKEHALMFLSNFKINPDTVDNPVFLIWDPPLISKISALPDLSFINSPFSLSHYKQSEDYVENYDTDTETNSESELDSEDDKPKFEFS